MMYLGVVGEGNDDFQEEVTQVIITNLKQAQSR